MSTASNIAPAHTADRSLPSTLFRNRNFLLLWAGYGVSALGDHLSEMGLLNLQHALDVKVTDATSRQAIMTLVFMLPFAVLGPLCGWLADRLPRRGLMIAADLIRAAIVVGMYGILMKIQSWLTPGHTPDQPMNLSVAVFPMLLVGTFAALFSPARLSLLPTLIRQDQLIRANAMTAGIGMIMTIVAAVLGGKLVEHYGARFNFQVNTLTFLLSAVFVFFIRPPQRPVTTESEAGLKALANGFRYTLNHRRVGEIIFVATVFWIAASIVRSIVPAIVKHFGEGYGALGLYQGYIGIGILLGSVTLAILGPALKNEIAISWSLKLAGLAVMLIVVSLWREWSKYFCIAGLFLTGYFGAGVLVSVNAVLQMIVPNYIRGRVFGVMDQASMIGLLLATGLLGIPDWPNIDQHIEIILSLTAIALLAVGIWTSLVRLKRGRFGRAVTFWRNVNDFYCRLFPRVRRDGLCTIPVQGGAIVAANHNSSLDPFLLSSCSPNRTPGFMIAMEYARIPGFRRLVASVDCVPVNRSGVDTASVKAALRHIKDGKLLGIFPQGKIQPPGEPPQIREGVGMLALRSGAPVIPAYISGIEYTESMIKPVFRRAHAVVRFGPPVDLSEFAGREKDRDAFREASEKIMAAIMSLRPDQGRAIDAGKPALHSIAKSESTV